MEVAISYYSKEIQETKSQNYRISYRPYLIESIILYTSVHSDRIVPVNDICFLPKY